MTTPDPTAPDPTTPASPLTDPDLIVTPAHLKLPRAYRSALAVIAWVPFGVPGDLNYASIPIGLTLARDAGAGACGVIDLHALDQVAAALQVPARGRLGPADHAMIAHLAALHLTPAEAHARFSGVSRACFQHWRVTPPRLVLSTRVPAEELAVHWGRAGGLPLVDVVSWDRDRRTL